MSMDLMVRVMKVRVGDPLSKLALLKLADNASDKGECWPSYQHIAEQCEISKRTAMNHIARLCACGFLRKESRKGPSGNTSNIYFLTPEKGDARMLENFKPVKKERARGSASDSLPPSAPDSPGVVHQIHQGSASDSLPPSAPAAPESVTLLNQSLNQSIKPSCPVHAEPDESSLNPAERVLAHFNRVTKSSYRDSKTTMGYIRGRLDEPEYAADDLILVTDYATAKWLNDPKMCDYLRPKTLFGPENFPEYRQKALKWNEAGRPECLNGAWLKAGSNFRKRDVNAISEPDNTIPEGFRG